VGLIAFEVFIVTILNQMLIFVPRPWNGLNLKQFVYESLQEKKVGCDMGVGQSVVRSLLKRAYLHDGTSPMIA
jgi:hypothetical protein